MSMRMIYRHVETERLEQHIFVENEILGLLLEKFFRRFGNRQIQAHHRYLDHRFKLARLLLHLFICHVRFNLCLSIAYSVYLCCQEQACHRHPILVKLCEWVKCIKSVHVNDCCVYAQLVTATEKGTILQLLSISLGNDYSYSNLKTIKLERRGDNASWGLQWMNASALISLS